MWDNVNLIINKKRPSSNIDNLKVTDKNLQQPSSISNFINRYFCNVPTELASKLPKADRHFSTYMRRKKSTFRFAHVNEIEVYLLLESIDTKKSFGYDKVRPLLLERLRFTFTPNGRREFLPRDPVSPLFSVYSLLLLHKNK